MDSDDLSDDDRAVFSAMGAIRFDAKAVASALRSNSLTVLGRHGLANLIEGKHPQGCRLTMVGQGRNWVPIMEGAALHNRAIAMAKMMDDLLENGASWEGATMDTADAFDVSESTVSRTVPIGRSLAND